MAKKYFCLTRSKFSLFQKRFWKIGITSGQSLALNLSSSPLGADLRPTPRKKLAISHDASFADRLKTAAAAKQAQLKKFQPRTAAPDPEFVARRDRRATELEAVRQARAEERNATRAARLAAEAAAAKDLAGRQQAALEAKRLDRKLRKSARRQDRSDSLAAFSRRIAE